MIQTYFKLEPFLFSGRVTFASNVPVMNSDVSGSTSIYWTPYRGNRLPVWNGTRFITRELSQLTNTTTDNTKNPAAVAADKNYYMVVWDDAGTIRLSRSPAWTGNNDPGTGAGTAEIEMVQGIYVNKVAITNGPGAGFGTVVGAVRSNGSSQMDWKRGGTDTGTPAAVPAFLYCWNMYNRVSIKGFVRESTNSWSVAAGAWASLNGTTNNRVSFILGLLEDDVSAQHTAAMATGSGIDTKISIGLDSTSAVADAAGIGGFGIGNSGTATAPANFASKMATVGYHFLQAIQKESGSTGTIYGDAGNGEQQQCFNYQLEM